MKVEKRGTIIILDGHHLLSLEAAADLRDKLNNELIDYDNNIKNISNIEN